MNIIEYGQEIYSILHSTPEVSGKEFETASNIKKIVESFWEGSLIYEGSEGLVYAWGNPGERFDLGFRAELDALSMPSGEVSHACGHDLHMSALIELMRYIVLTNIQKQILFVFQSAEERGNGAYKLTQILKNNNILVDRMISIHNAPELNTNSFAVSEGRILANNYTNQLKFSFLESERYTRGMNLSSWIHVLDMIEKEQEKYPDVNFSIGEFQTNGTSGVQAEHLKMTLSLRSHLQSLDKLKAIFNNLVEKLSNQEGVKICSMNINEHWQIINDKYLYNILKSYPYLTFYEIPSGFTSDDFCYYEKISDAILYLFVGSNNDYTPYHGTHTHKYKPDLDFLRSSLRIYKYILEVA